MENILLAEARLKLNGVSKHGQILQSLCQRICQDLAEISQLVSTSRLNFGAEDIYEIFHQLSLYEVKLGDTRVKLREIESKLPSEVIAIYKNDVCGENPAEMVSDLEGRIGKISFC